MFSIGLVFVVVDFFFEVGGLKTVIYYMILDMNQVSHTILFVYFVSYLGLGFLPCMESR